MTALKGCDHDGLLQDAFEASRVHVEESPEDIAIDAAQSGMRLLANLIQETRNGKPLTCTLQEIGQALVGTPAPPVNWYFQLDRAKRHERLLEGTRRLLIGALESLSDDPGQRPNTKDFLEDALSELDDYKPAEPC